MIRACALTALALMTFGPVSAQMTFNDRASFCKVASEVSTPSLVARTQNIPRARAEALMDGMTDPQAIRMVQEVIAFAYSRPANTPLEQLRADLNSACLAHRIFTQ